MPRSATQMRIPSATYRLQFNSAFPFSAAQDVIPYLEALGISDCYASPIFQASPGSTHGYDVCGFGQVNPHLGGQTGFVEFASALKRRGLGLLVDMVPNHMGNDLSNKWWMDVLRNGTRSPYAFWFDINWDALDFGGSLRDQVLLPILEARYGQVLETGKLQVVWHQPEDRDSESGPRFWIKYYDREFPCSDAAARDILNAIEPGENQAESINAVLEKLNGTPGKSESFDALDALLRRQHYRLAFWRIGPQEINYRRFFDVTELVSMRTELQAAFDAMHELLFALVRDHLITGLRIDHPDGLWDPLQYFNRLRTECPLYIVAEKILTGDESLPADWPVQGTTGYDYLQRVNGLFVLSANEPSFDTVYEEFTNLKPGAFQDEVIHCKRLVLERSFPGDLNALGHRLWRICMRSRDGRDFSLPELQKAVAEMAVAFPVYRTYITAQSATPSEPDRSAIRRAAVLARKAICKPGTDEESPLPNSPEPVNFLERLLLLDLPDAEKEWAAVMEFIMRFQQLTGPLMAKGLEDTAFYRYARLLSLNEVGGDPARFGISLEEFHACNRSKLKFCPHSLSATATHDTKRGEDVRARLNVLSEVPDLWAETLTKCSARNAVHKTNVNDRPAPDANDEYIIYQTLLGAWPVLDKEAGLPADFEERIQACILKSLKESKRHTSWTDPNEAYENSTRKFVHNVLNEPLPQEFEKIRQLVAYHGCFNSLSQTLLKICSPGVPDFYQGTELWDLSLVDPDNRRPVDFKLRQSLLGQLQAQDSASADHTEHHAALLANWRDARIKLYLTWKALNFRKTHQDIFLTGDYIPLETRGTRRENLCAFARCAPGQSLVVVVPRYTCSLMSRQLRPPIGADAWEDTVILLPHTLASCGLENIFTAFRHKPGLNRVSEILRTLPFALLVTN